MKYWICRCITDNCFGLKHILIVFATCCHHYDPCPVPMYLKCFDYFVFISTNEILDIQMSHRQLLWFVTYLNCFATRCQQFGGNICQLTIILWSLPSLNVPNMFRLLGCYAKLNLQNVSQVFASYIQYQPIFPIETYSPNCWWWMMIRWW